MSDNNNVTIERKKFTKTEKQYLRVIIHNLSLQRLTDQEIVDYLQREKKIDISRSAVTKIKNQVVEEAGNWYIELRESAYKYLAVYKERLDSLLSYQKKLHEIMTSAESPEIGIRAIAELHRIEMSIFSIFKELPQFDIRPTTNTDSDSIPPTVEELPGIGGEGSGPIVMGAQMFSYYSPSISNNEPEPEPEPITKTPYSSPIEEQEPERSDIGIQEPEEEEEEEPEESEADRYWRTHPSRVKPHNNNKVKFVIE